jgi:hypothetical protein
MIPYKISVRGGDLIMATANARTVFVLGKEIQGNRQVLIVESGEEYTLDTAAVEVYSDDTAQFPYEL